MASDQGDKKSIRIYVGRLPADATTKDLEKEFNKFGSHGPIFLKSGYAFFVYCLLFRLTMMKRMGMRP